MMRYPEIQAAVVALRNTRGLPWPKEYRKKTDDDILDWLQATFGFQKDNVANQREHLILLLANVHIKQFPKPDQQPKVCWLVVKQYMKHCYNKFPYTCNDLLPSCSIVFMVDLDIFLSDELWCSISLPYILCSRFWLF